MKLFDGSRISLLETVYLFCVVVYSAAASHFVRQLGTPFTLGNAFLVVFSLVMLFRLKINLAPRFLILSVCLVGYSVLTFIANQYVSMGFIPRWLIYFFVGYTVCQVFKSKMFVAFETMIFYLTVIAVVIWIFYLMFPTAVRQLVVNFSLPTFSDNINYITYNCVFFTLNGDEAIMSDYFLMERNAGFAWEPGVFGCFICLAILFNLLRTNGKLSSNVKLYFLVAALFTTQSTTGGFVLLVILAGWLLTTSKNKILYSILFIPLIIYAFSLSFIGDKFTDEFTEAFSANSLSAGVYNGRLFSFRLAWLEFSQHPIIGLGGSPSRYLDSIGFDVPIFNGIGVIFITFGIFALAYFIMIKKTGDCINVLYDSRSGVVLLLCLICCFFSYNLIQTPVFMALTTYSLYYTKNYQNC